MTIRVRHTGQPECVASRAYPSVTMRSVSSMTGRDDRRKRIIQLTGETDATEGFLATFREATPVVAAEPLTPLDRSTVFVAVTVTTDGFDSIAELLAELGVHYRMGTTITDGWERWTLYLDPGDDLAGVIEAIAAGDNEVELVRQVDMRERQPVSQFEPVGTLQSLTQRQRDALAAALGVGYYDHDTDTALEDVAAELDVTTTTAWEHLSRAEETVMTDFGGLLGVLK